MPPFAELVKSYPEVFKGWKPVRIDKPREGDWYLTELGTEMLRANTDFKYIRIIVEKDVAPISKNNVYVEPPEGFECTGEFRSPKYGEWYIAGDGTLSQVNTREAGHEMSYTVRPILRKIWKPLPWMKSGHWLCRNPGATVSMYTVERPEQLGFFYKVIDPVNMHPEVFTDFVPPVEVGVYLFQIA